MFSRYAAIGAVHVMLAVAFGAFGAHGLQDRLTSAMLQVFETGVRYQMYHGLGILLVVLFAAKLTSSRMLLWSLRLLHLGIVLFSGSLYVLSLSGWTKLGMVTPIGGLSFLCGWAIFAIAAVKASTRA